MTKKMEGNVLVLAGHTRLFFGIFNVIRILENGIDQICKRLKFLIKKCSITQPSDFDVLKQHVNTKAPNLASKRRKMTKKHNRPRSRDRLESVEDYRRSTSTTLDRKKVERSSQVRGRVSGQRDCNITAGEQKHSY